MSVNAGKLGLSAALIAAASYTICALFVAVAPGALSRFFGFVLHVDLSGLFRSINFISYLVGMLVWSALVGVHVWLAAALYNRLASRAQP